MKKHFMWFFIVFVMIFIYSAFAQNTPYVTTARGATFINENLHFFSSLVCGVILAVAFHLIFTNLFVAAGISMMKPEEKIRPGRTPDESDTEEGNAAATIKKINYEFGVWMLIVTSICLFFATWFAVEISGALTRFTGAIIALTVWGAFYAISLSIETSILTTAIGSLFRTAASTMQGVGKGVKAVLEKSPETQAADTAARITQAVRDEIFGELDTGNIRKELQSYIQQLRPPSARDIKNEIADLLKDTEIRQYPDVDQLVTRFEQESPNKQRAKSIGNQFRQAFNEFRQQRQQGKDTVSAGVEAAMRATGKGPEEAQQQRQQLEEYLRKTNKQELQPEELKKRIQTIFTRPKEGIAQIKESIGAIDKNTTVTLLEQRQDISHEEAVKIADNIQNTLNTMKSLLGTGTQKAGEQVSGMKETVENKLRDYINSLQEPEFNYDDIKDDLRLLFHDPKAGADSLINRLKSLDRDTLKTVIASRSDISEEQAEKIISRIEETRDDVIAKAQEMKLKVQQKIRDAQETAARVTQETRENAAIAAWWAFGTALCSGIASVIGAYVAFRA
jgi:ElaB/YqjD/DUF883 family membrane-anchored ribosome-binding protein